MVIVAFILGFGAGAAVSAFVLVMLLAAREAEEHIERKKERAANEERATELKLATSPKKARAWKNG